MKKSDIYIEVNNISHGFNGKQVLHDVNFTASRGEVLGFLGPNGAGKTTTMRVISGFFKPSIGTVKIHGQDIASAGDSIRHAIGYLPEGAPLWGDLSVQDYLKIMAGLRGLTGKERENALKRVISDTQLFDVLPQPIHTLSKGYKRRVGLAQAFLSNPDIMILDEPTDGLDPNQKHQMRELIKRVAVDKAIIISTHILEEVDALCNKVLLLAEGRVKFTGTPQEFIKIAPSTSKNRIEESFRILSAKDSKVKATKSKPSSKPSQEKKT